MWPVLVRPKVLVERKLDLLTSAQGFFNDESANATSGPEYQNAHRGCRPSLLTGGMKENVRDEEPVLRLTWYFQASEDADNSRKSPHQLGCLGQRIRRGFDRTKMRIRL